MSEVGTLKKGLSILELIIEKGSLSVSEIVEMLPLNKSTTYRLVSTLEQNNFIEKNAENSYKVSRKLIDKLTNNGLNFDMETIILQASHTIKELTGETIFIGILSGEQIMATHIIPGRFPTRTHYEKGETLPIYQSAIGKCILAFKSASIQDSYKEKMNASADVEAFFGELARVFEAGYAVDDEQAEAGVRCVAAPIWKDGQIVAGIAISGPSARVCREKDEENGQLVKYFSRHITEALEN
ncbi:IclR family transcriptional regulator [Paenibacillus shenyangensis]|uniref:IclR family transcriptional regulator n=1 Tax=Paenibacillus sp. A9 TaxID=1284352 RepID=UPI0003630010|nr:IclR family transcriptional regulator [Paenibacillus sp. A9]